MITIRADYDTASKRKLELYGWVAPDILRRAYGRAANSAKKALFATMRGHGNSRYNVPKLAKRQALTVQMNGGRQSDVFGKFSTDSRYHVSYVRGTTQVIGWPDRLEGFMSALQSAENHALSDGEIRHMRARLNARGARNVRLPASYSRPERDLIGPFTNAMVEVYPNWIMRNFEKLYNERIAKGAS